MVKVLPLTIAAERLNINKNRLHYAELASWQIVCTSPALSFTTSSVVSDCEYQLSSSGPRAQSDFHFIPDIPQSWIPTSSVTGNRRPSDIEVIINSVLKFNFTIFFNLIFINCSPFDVGIRERLGAGIDVARREPVHNRSIA